MNTEREQSKRTSWWPWAIVALMIGAAVAIPPLLESGKHAVERANIQTRVTPTSTTDATADLIDEDFRFEIRWPGAGHQVLHEPEAKRLAPSARGAVVSDSGCVVAVVADYRPGATLPALVSTMVNALPPYGRKVVSSATSELSGIEGTALVVESEVLGKPQSYGLFVTARDGWTIAVVRWNRHTASTCDELATAVSLLDGSVTGRAPVSEKRTEVRRAYSVRDQVYLNPSDRLRVEAPEGSTVVAGADALRRGGAAVAIVSAGLEVQVTSARPSNATVVERLQRWMDVNGETLPAAPRFTRELGGAKLPFYEVKPGNLGPALLGGGRVGSRELYFMVPHAPALRAEAEAFLDKVLAATTVLDDAAAEAAQRTLPAVDATRTVELDRSLRAERFVDYANGVRVAPGAAPAVAVLAGVIPMAPDARLTLLRPDAVFTVLLARRTTADLEAAQLEIAGEVVRSEIAPEEATFSAGTGGRSRRMRATYELGGLGSGTLQIDTFQHASGDPMPPDESRWIHVVTWGEAGAFGASESATESLLGGVTLEKPPIPMTAIRGSHLEDARLGFAIDLPGGGWNIRAASRPLAADAAMYEADSSHGRVQIICNYLSEADAMYEAWTEQDFARSALKDFGVPTRSDSSLAGLPARRLDWEKGSAVVLRDGRAVFAVSVVPGPGVAPEEVYRGFRLLR